MTIFTAMRMRLAAALVGSAATIVAQNHLTCRADEAAKKMTSPNSIAKTIIQDSSKNPNAVDLRPWLEKWELAPRVQGDRPTCSVFVVTEALEYAFAAKQGQGARLSVEFLNWAKNRAGNSADDGAFFSDLWKGYEVYGICPEADVPYRDQFDPALKPDEKSLAQGKAFLPHGMRLHWIKEWDPNKGVNAEQLAEIKRTLARGWPVGGGFLWPSNKKLENNVLKVVPRSEVVDGHSVLLVGYRDDEKQPGGGVFLFRNTSGESRDSEMTYEYALTYMNDAIWIDYEGAKDIEIASTEKPQSALGTAAGGAAAACEPLFRDPLGALTAPPSGRNRRISSNEQPNWNDGNMDMTWLQPGESIEMPLLEGPGYITHIWFTSHAGWANELNALSIRIYWDGRKEPGVESPLGDFFGCGTKPAVVESMPVQVSPTGALTCYWRMPFARSAKIVVTNDNPDRGAGLYWQVDWVQVDRLPPETGYFHAKYRQEYPAAMGRDYLIADLAGRGQFVGTVMSVTNAQDGWFGEGDDFFYIDGEKVPSLQGTGSEDYFNDAWGFRPRTSHWFGSPRWQGDRAGDSGTLYRWHVLDPVRFDRSLQLTIEHKGNEMVDLEGFFVERPDFLSSVAFWYQIGEPKPFGKMPPWNERRVPWDRQNLVKAFLKAKTTGSAKVKVEAQGFFGSRPILSWPNKENGARLTLPFTVAEDGRYAVRLTAMQGPRFGSYEILFDGNHVADADFFAPSGGDDGEGSELDLLLGTHELTKGAHEITFVATAPDGKAALPLAVEMLRLLKLPPKAVRKVKNDNEAHFIRLGIGRSLYAYRLAYGKLPDTLETLVESGIMPERYLRDENDYPLKARREGDFMHVESTGPTGWKHRWSGLDPRR
ncbi:MAG: DUF2961 domain-containing protein [Pirellulales bacterium]|nr:DUF2961 domain-containing protein [Pirellulales bacterium]